MRSTSPEIVGERKESKISSQVSIERRGGVTAVVAYKSTDTSSFFCRDPLTSTNVNGRRAKAKLSHSPRHSNPGRKSDSPRRIHLIVRICDIVREAGKKITFWRVVQDELSFDWTKKEKW